MDISSQTTKKVIILSAPATNIIEHKNKLYKNPIKAVRVPEYLPCARYPKAKIETITPADDVNKIKKAEKRSTKKGKSGAEKTDEKLISNGADEFSADKEKITPAKDAANAKPRLVI